MDVDALMDYVQSAKGPTPMATRERAHDVPLSAFRRTRVVCLGFTVWYLLTWIACWVTENKTDESWVQANRWTTAIEFMSTGFAETATIADLLLTLPSKAGGRAAIAHFVMCELASPACASLCAILSSLLTLPRLCLPFQVRAHLSRRDR